MIGRRVLLDTNIVLAYLLGQPFALDFVSQHTDAEIMVSVITRMELLSYPDLTRREEEDIRKFLSCVRVIPLDEPIESTATDMRRISRCKLPDCIIAASAFHADAVLVTCDTRLSSITYPRLQAHNPAPSQSP